MQAAVKALLIIAIAAAALAAGLWLPQLAERAEPDAAHVPPPLPVSAEQVRRQPLPRSLEGLGQLEARRQVQVAAEADGLVTEIAFESGQRVKAGALLVQVDDRAERAELKRYRAQLQLAQRELKRLLALENVGATRSRVDQERSRVAEVQSSIAHTEALLDHKHISAPFDGVLGIRRVQPGQYLQAGDPLVTLTDVSGFWVNFVLPESALSAVAVGQSAQVHIDAWPEQAFAARVTSIEPQIDGELHTVMLQAALIDPPEYLRPGLFARVRVELPPEPDAILLPETAVESNTYGDSVYVLQRTADGEGWQALPVAVTLGQRAGGRVAIRSGLKPGDQVVIAGQNRLYPGARVSPQPGGDAVAGERLR